MIFPSVFAVVKNVIRLLSCFLKCSVNTARTILKNSLRQKRCKISHQDIEGLNGVIALTIDGKLFPILTFHG